MLIEVDVKYKDGLRRRFTACGETLLEDFCRHIESFGSVRSVGRFIEVQSTGDENGQGQKESQG
jgi:hypothetical protein